MTASDNALLSAALRVDDQLDDIARARIWSRLEDRLVAPPRRSWRWRLAWAGVAAVTVAAAALLLLRAPHDGRELTAPADATLTTHLGPHTRAALVGPATLHVIGEPGAVTTVRLDRGTLLAEFTGGPGRALHVDAPGLQVDVVGTLFAVEVAPTRTCVAVAHGRVQVRIGSHTEAVATGQQRCTVAPGPTAIEPQLRRALERHATIVAVLDPTEVPAELPASDAAVAIAPAAPVPAASPALSQPAPRGIAPSQPAPSQPAPSQPAPRAVATRESITTTSTTSRPAADKHDKTNKTDNTDKTDKLGKLDDLTRPAAPAPAASPPPSNRAAVSALPTSPSPREAPPTPEAPPPLPAVPPPPPTPESLYEQAETALARRDLDAADRALAKVVASAPASALAGQALYERARIAYQRRAWADARHHLQALAQLGDTALSESGRYLTCRIAVETGDANAVRCLTDFRAAYPKSAHDRDVLGTLAQLTFTSGGCTAAKQHIAELAARYPHSALTAAWRAKCQETR